MRPGSRNARPAPRVNHASEEPVRRRSTSGRKPGLASSAPPCRSQSVTVCRAGVATPVSSSHLLLIASHWRASPAHNEGAPGNGCHASRAQDPASLARGSSIEEPDRARTNRVDHRCAGTCIAMHRPRRSRTTRRRRRPTTKRLCGSMTARLRKSLSNTGSQVNAFAHDTIGVAAVCATWRRLSAVCAGRRATRAVTAR